MVAEFYLFLAASIIVIRLLLDADFHDGRWPTRSTPVGCGEPIAARS